MPAARESSADETRPAQPIPAPASWALEACRVKPDSVAGGSREIRGRLAPGACSKGCGK